MLLLNDVDEMKETGIWLTTMFVPSYFQWTGIKNKNLHKRKKRSFLGKPIAAKIKSMEMLQTIVRISSMVEGKV